MYVKIRNNDDKVWILPLENISVALNLYQPSSIKGILLKKYLPICMKMQWTRLLSKRVLHIEDCDLEVPDDVLAALKKVFENDEVEFAYFAGTPSTHQKGTIQIFFDNNILGYAKISANKDVQLLFQKEKEFLDLLDKCVVWCVPKCLLCDTIGDENMIFVQDTIKTQESKIIHEISEVHVEFLQEFCEKTSVKCAYQTTDYYKKLEELKNNLYILDDLKIDTQAVLKAIAIVEERFKNEKEFCAFHGDFTPWNTFVENNHLFVFDFEYAKKTYPKYLDVFHFFTQRLIFEKNMNANQIMELFEKEVLNSRVSVLFKNSYESYLQYLLSVIAFFVQRDKGVFSSEGIKNLQIWVELVELTLKQIEISRDCKDNN